MKKKHILITVIIIILVLSVNTLTWYFSGKNKIYQLQFEKIVEYTPYLTEHWGKNIYVFLEGTPGNKEIHLDDYSQYHPIIIFGNYIPDSVRKSANNHLLVIKDAFNNPFYNDVKSSYFWTVRSGTSSFHTVYIWFFTHWLIFNTDRDIKNHLNEILYKPAVILGNNLWNIEEKFGRPVVWSKRNINGFFTWHMEYDGLIIEGYDYFLRYSGGYIELSKIGKIIVTNPKYTTSLPFNIGDNVSKAEKYISNRFILTRSDTEIVYAKTRDDFKSYELHRLSIRFKGDKIQEIGWKYGD